MINTNQNAPQQAAPMQAAPQQAAPMQAAPQQAPAMAGAIPSAQGAAPQAAAAAQPAQQTPFLKGQAAQQAMQQEQAKADMRSNGTYRFYVKHKNGQSEERMITFLDGNLTPDGLLDIPFINEHRVRINGDTQNIACTEPNEPCPLCQAAQESNSQDFSFAAFTGYLTVIDHTGYVDNTGKHHPDVIRLYPAKRKQIEMLTKLAHNYGTLAGLCFNVSRSSDKSAAVGDIMIPQGQYNPQDLIAHYKSQDANSKIGILDYNKEVTYFDAKTLRSMLGMGSPIGGQAAPQAQPYNVNTGIPQQQAPQQAAPQQMAGAVPQQAAPQQAAPPMQQAPQQQAAPTLQMIATDYTYQQYIEAGWTDQSLIDHGKAQLVQAAPQQQQAAPPPQQAPAMMTQTGEAPQQEAPVNAPFPVTDPNQAGDDVNAQYGDQL